MRLQFAAMAVAASILFGGTAAQASPDRGSFSGRALFEGVYLQTGPACVAIQGECSVLTTRQRASAARLENAVAAKDRRFFAEFATEMTSGDPGVVSSALVRGADDVRRVATITEKRGFHPDDGSIAVLQTTAATVTARIIFYMYASAIVVMAQPPGKDVRSINVAYSSTAGLSNETNVARITRDLASR
jgi:hypothetical protein